MVDEAKKPKTDHSRMSLERLKELCDEVFNDTNLEYSIANPLFGYMFKTDGCLENIRFFSSEIIAVYDENNSRDYSKDTSENSLTSLVILLFPSPLGVLNNARNTLSNFTNKYFIDNKDYDEISSTDSRNKNIKMLANTFIKLYKDGTSNELKQPNIKKATPYKMFEYYVFAPSDVPGLENTNLKLLTIHAYALSVIDNTDEFRVYLETISEGLKDIENDRLECLVLSDQQKKEFKELYMNHFNFPYSKINQPVSNSSIPIYNRQTDEFSKTQKFSDCTDIVILHLCNCLFYNEQTGKCSLANLKSESNISDECTRLIEFYEKYNNKPFNITYEMRMDWSRVVQGLSDNEAFERQAKYKPYVIRYVNQEYRNEIKAGAISIINVLAKICNIEKIYKNIMTENAVMMYSLGKKLSYLFNKISSDQIEIVKIKGDDIREFEYKGIKDFSGKYEMTFKLAPSADSVKMLLDVQNGHAELKFVSMDSNQMKDSLKDYDVKSGDMTLRSLLNRYVKMIKNRDEKTQNYDFSFEILYNQGPLQVDDQKIEQLICLYEYIDRQDNIDHSLIKRTIANIVKSADLSDQATRKLFIPFFIYIDDLIPNLNISEIFETWLALYLNGTAIKSEVIRSLWNEQRGLKRMEVTSLTLPSPCIATDDMKMLLYSIRLELEELTLTAFNKNPEELVDIVGSLLSYNSKLSELTIKENGLGSKDCADIFNVLKDNKTLRILDISYNNITSEYSEQIANALMVNNTLIILSISGNKLDNIGIRQLARGLMVNNGLLLIVLANSKLTDLGVRYICEALKSPSSTLIGISLFGNLITKKGAEYLADALKINQTLTTLDISNNPVGDEGLKHLSEALKTNKTLQKFLCLSCSITATGAKYISEALKTSTALTDLNIASNSLGDYGIWYISEALKLNQHLQLLKICNIGIKAPGVKYIAEALGKNRTLKVLDLSDISLDDESLKYISESSKTNQTLSTLSICYMPMIGFGINYISDILKINKGIEKLDLSQVTLLDMNTNIKNFFDGIRMNITITELSICTKYLKPETSQLLFDALKVNTTIKSLRISQNGTFCKDFGSDLAKDAKEKDREILLCSF